VQDRYGQFCQRAGCAGNWHVAAIGGNIGHKLRGALAGGSAQNAALDWLPVADLVRTWPAAGVRVLHQRIGIVWINQEQRHMIVAQAFLEFFHRDLHHLLKIKSCCNALADARDQFQACGALLFFAVAARIFHRKRQLLGDTLKAVRFIVVDSFSGLDV
jgi:hypothetical protein